MVMSSFIVVLIIFILSAIVILRPFLVPQKQAKVRSSERYDALFAERERLYSNIEELDQALELNKISPDDHTQSRTMLLNQAALVLAQLDKIGGKPKKQRVKDTSSDIDNELEQMIKVRRETLQKDKSAICPHCDEPVEAGDQFCRKCGEAL